LATEVLAVGSAPTVETIHAIATPLANPHRKRVDLAGVLVDQVDLEGAVERIRHFADSGTAHHIVTVNLDFLRIAQDNDKFRATINDADLAVADGMPLVWASRLMEERIPERVTGVELVERCCRLAAERGQVVFLLGAAPGVAAAAAGKLRERIPTLQTYAYSPPFGALSEEDDACIVELIREVKPTYLFVALGAPRQDLWIRDHQQELQIPVAMGVGCVFDLFAGVTRRAPSWMRRGGLEWSYRLVREPGRLWRRYIVQGMPMFGRLLLVSTPLGAGQAIAPAPRQLHPHDAPHALD
jgi:N-acetylglucosaminyldiphosphoundecaprenol N-acetyl-beta-D-mannosaminyltransferase